ncbi:hypothetical protein DL764_003154 [Monosporascus ibericus]|uniref:DUF5672 domain-containing protein n=1 Tax=Monosporascus ibericus TaxID=155417 RepID=A0A4Q4TIN1_9PEZI|nr:hypothetical protein DL764_003154 [Monosporascus ibericus]
MVSILWSGTSRRTRLAAAFLLTLILATYLSFPTIREADVPRVSIGYKQPLRSPYNESKVALLIENRADPILAPLMLHFMSVVPPDWRFRFMGSTESVEHINQSVAIRQQVSAGKLDLTYIPSNVSTAGQEMISRFLTDLWLYETALRPAEWLLVFQTDSILCANSRQTLNDYLEYDWVGAPWDPGGRFGGNGGLSLRRVSPIIDILREQVRIQNSEPEDAWLADRLGHRPGAKMANGTVSLTFSGEAHSGAAVEIGKTSGADRLANYGSDLEAAEERKYAEGIDDWREGFYEPMGYHTGGGGTILHGSIWGTPERRKHIWDYCPEVKMTLKMDAAKYVTGNCNPNWKRDGERGYGHVGAGDLGYGTEVIDGVEYPMLPPNLVPW